MAMYFDQVWKRHRFSGALACVTALLSIALSATAWPGLARASKSASVGPASAEPPATLMQVRSGAHVLGFGPEAVLVAGLDHVLKVRFVDAGPAVPEFCRSGHCSQHAPMSGSPSTETGEVRYHGLWPGIDLQYDTADGIVRSTYTIAPGASPQSIRLAYNIDFDLESTGDLAIRFPSGMLTETAPIAWQEVAGRRRSVQVAFVAFPDRQLGFRIGDYDPNNPLVIDPTLVWHTFLGGTGSDFGVAIAAEATAGNVYVVGTSSASWGSTPGIVRAHSGQDDAFVARLSTTTGQLVWYTFLGGGGLESGSGVAVDDSGRVFVTGSGESEWSAVQPNPAPPPVRPMSGQRDAFVARLDGATGFVQWLTYLGSGGFDAGQAIAEDGQGNLYVTGQSPASWPPGPEPAPLRAYSGAEDVFVSKLLVASGALVWNTFLGGATSDLGGAVAVDPSGNVFVTGRSADSWGSNPVHGHSGGTDAFVARLAGTGSIAWHTFLGGTSLDEGNAIATDQAGSVYISGRSDGNWGLPVRPFAGGREAFAARLIGASGVLSWHTFLGSPGSDFGFGIASDSLGRIFVTGRSPSTWGTPIRPISPGGDAFAALLLASDGSLQSNTFLGGDGADEGVALSCDGNDQAYLIGTSDFSWGVPVRPHAGFGTDTFVARLRLDVLIFRDGFE